MRIAEPNLWGGATPARNETPLAKLPHAEEHGFTSFGRGGGLRERNLPNLPATIARRPTVGPGRQQKKREEDSIVERSAVEMAPFLRAIVAHPNEDTPRLIFADYLEEQGDPEAWLRAQFIRLQCELARLPPDAPRRAALQRQEQELLQARQTAWRGELPEVPGIRWETFRRGMVEVARIEEPAAFFANVELLFQATPLRELSFSAMTPRWTVELAPLRWLAQIWRLDFECGNRLGETGARALAQSPFLGGLEHLDLRSNYIGALGVRALTDSETLTQLRHLNLDWNIIEDSGALHLAQARHWNDLEHLSLGWNRLTDRGLIALADSPLLRHVSCLYLSGNAISDVGVSALAQSKHLRNLASLYLDMNQIGDAGLQALAESSCLPSLRRLYLNNNRFTAIGVEALIESPNLAALSELALGGVDFDEAITQRLRDQFGYRVWWT